MNGRLAVVFGGSGFIGRHIVKRLAGEGYSVRVCVRDIEKAAFLKTYGNPGQIVTMACNIRDAVMVSNCVKGAHVAFSLVGLLFQAGKQTFDQVHVEGAKHIAQACLEHGVKNLIHLSAIGADEYSPAQYARTKALGEKAVLQDFPETTILRPSVVFGPEDNFFNQFASMMRLAPALPVIGTPPVPFHKVNGALELDLYGDGGAKMQPVYVGDVAQAAINSIDNEKAKGQIFELGGPEVMTFKGIMERIFKHTGRKRILMPLPYGIAKVMGSVMGLLPKPPLTKDQVVMLETDNVVDPKALSFKDIGIDEPALADLILPTYLGRFKEARNQSVHAQES